MPTMYETVAGFQNSALGVSLKPFWTGLAAGQLERYIFDASDEVTRYTDRKLLLIPGAAVGATGSPFAAGVTSLPVTNACNIWPGDAIVFDRTSESLEIADAAVADPPVATDAATMQYAGTLYFITPTLNQYASGDTFKLYRQDRYQIQPPVGRKFMPLREYPLYSVHAAYQALPAPELETLFDPTQMVVETGQRGVELIAGNANPPRTLWRVQYQAGYLVVPYPIRVAVQNYVAAEIAKAMNPMGAMMIRSEGTQAHMTRSTQQRDTPPPRSYFIEEAERKLEEFCRRWVIA